MKENLEIVATIFGIFLAMAAAMLLLIAGLFVIADAHVKHCESIGKEATWETCK